MAQFLRNPPAGWKPEGWEPPPTAVQIRDFSPGEMLKTGRFWRLWIALALGTTAGLMVIGHLKPFGIESGLGAEAAAVAVGMLGFANGAGRPIWGFILDRIGMTKTLFLIYGMQGVLMLFFAKLGYPLIVLILASSFIGFNFGGKLGVFPALTANYFGIKHLGMNYGLMLTAWGVGGIIGPMVGGTVFDMTGEYVWAFIAAGVLCLIGGAIVVPAGRVRPPQPAS